MERSSMDPEPLSRLTTHLLAEILSRVDGPTLGAAACACTYLRRAAAEDALWEELCRGAWPSTMATEAGKLVSSMPGGFAKLYADSLPLLLYRPCDKGRPSARSASRAPVAPPELLSFVDVYYKKRCVLSRIVQGVPEQGLSTWSTECPFKLVAPSANGGGSEDVEAPPPSIPLDAKEEGGVGVLNWALEEDITLSWILVDVEGGRAVSLAGGRPTAVQGNWPWDADVVLRFGCPVPVEQQLLACGVAECVVCVRCQVVSESEDHLRCTAIELLVEDGDGVQLDGRRGLAVLERALCQRARTRDRRAVDEGYGAYLNERRVTREKEIGVGEMACMALLSGLCLLVFRYVCGILPFVEPA